MGVAEKATRTRDVKKAGCGDDLPSRPVPFSEAACVLKIAI